MSRTTLRPGAARRRPGRVTALTVAGLSSVLLLAACGDASGDGGSNAASGSGDCSAPGVTDSEITLASVSPLTGPAATTFAGFVEGAQARFDAQNDEGGIGGRKIKLETNDDAGDGATQVTAARNAVQQQEAFAVLSASRVDTMYDFLQQQGVPVLGYPGQPAYAKNDNAFGYSGGAQTGYFASATVERMKKAGGTTFAILAHNSPGSLNSANGMIQAVEKAGLKVGVRSFDVPLGSFDATSLAIQMKENGVDAIYAPVLTDSSISVLRAAEQQGITLKANFVSQVYDPSVAKQISQYIQGALTSTVATVPNEVTGNADVDAYKAAMKKYQPKTEPSAGWAEAGYISADLFLTGVEKTGDCLTQESFIKTVRGLKDYDGGGLLVEPAVFSGGIHPNGSSPYGACTWYVVREGDSWVPDDEAVCGEMVKIAS